MQARRRFHLHCGFGLRSEHYNRTELSTHIAGYSPQWQEVLRSPWHSGRNPPLLRSPPRLEQMRSPTSALHCEREDEYHHLSAFVKGFITRLDMDTLIQIRILTSSDDVVVFGKPARVARAQPPLRNDCDCEVGENR